MRWVLRQRLHSVLVATAAISAVLDLSYLILSENQNVSDLTAMMICRRCTTHRPCEQSLVRSSVAERVTRRRR